QPRMVVPLHHPKRIRGHVFARHEPGGVIAGAALGAALLHAADAQALALAQGVETQALMLAQHPAPVALDRAGLLRDVAVQEFTERALADEADAGGILFFRIRQADL